ncbi:MAG: glycosyltransferase [Verrucomicrobiota bacterium]
MKIVELGKFYPPHYGGIETLLRSWCEGFVASGAEVDCVVAHDHAQTVHEQIGGVRVHRFASFGTLLSTSICPGYLRALGRYPADLWHSHFPNPLADVAVLTSSRRTPLVISYHSDIVRQAGLMRLYGGVVRRLLDRAARIIVATPRHFEFSPWLQPFAAKTEVIPFGINLDRLSAVDPAHVAEFRARAKEHPILLTIGRLVGYKGHRYLLEAARELDALVWIVGNGPLETELRRLTREWQLEDRVRFWGSVSDADLPAMLHACDVFVLPSITPNEAFGLVQVEAMACGKPVVSCDLRSGVPFVNQHGVTGLVVPPANSSALAEALKRLLGDEELRQQMGRAGRDRAHKEFAEKVMIERYWACFERLTA